MVSGGSVVQWFSGSERGDEMAQVDDGQTEISLMMEVMEMMMMMDGTESWAAPLFVLEVRSSACVACSRVAVLPRFRAVRGNSSPGGYSRVGVLGV